MSNKPVQFKPDGKDLQRVMLYYGIEPEEQIVCPFHDDSRPSCHVNYEEGIFHCFACEASGDAFKFVKLANPKIDGLNQLILYHAIINSKKVNGAKLRSYRKPKSKKQKRVERERDLEFSHDYYFGLRTEKWEDINHQVKDYMLSRGFTTKTLNDSKMKLTYTNKNFPIIIPIFDLGQFRGYVCRTLNKHIEKRGKYLYNKGFSRINTLGGDYNSEVVVLVEGYLDMLKMRQHGLKNVAAIFGWKITRDQVNKLKARGVKTIISALDTDRPGKKGTDYLHNFFDEVIPFQFPKGVKDPGELTSKQFRIAYRKTKNLYRSRRKSNVNS